MDDFRTFLTRFKNRPTASGPSPWGLGFLIEQVGSGFETVVAGLEQLEQIIMTSAQNTDALVQAATASLASFETTATATLTTLDNDLSAVLADVTSAGSNVQPATVTALQNAIASLGTLGTGLSSAVTQIDAAVNPAPSPAPSGS